MKVVFQNIFLNTQSNKQIFIKFSKFQSFLTENIIYSFHLHKTEKNILLNVNYTISIKRPLSVANFYITKFVINKHHSCTNRGVAKTVVMCRHLNETIGFTEAHSDEWG